MYKRRIGSWLLWRAGPARKAEAPPKAGVLAPIKWIGAGVAITFGGLVWLGMSVDDGEADWALFCHGLIASNEFLYIH